MKKLPYIKVVLFISLLFNFSYNEKKNLAPTTQILDSEVMSEDLTITSAKY